LLPLLLRKWLLPLRVPMLPLLPPMLLQPALRWSHPMPPVRNCRTLPAEPLS
jgi:hypothetical protein